MCIAGVEWAEPALLLGAGWRDMTVKAEKRLSAACVKNFGRIALSRPPGHPRKRLLRKSTFRNGVKEREREQEPLEIAMKKDRAARSQAQEQSRQPAIEHLKRKEVEGTVEAFLETAFKGEAELITEFIAAGLDVNATLEGRTALMWASWRGYAEAVQVLLAHGARVEARDPEDTTALMFASDLWPKSDGHVEIVRLLLAHGAEVNAKNKNGMTAIMAASVCPWHGTGSSEHFKVVQILLAHGASVDVRDHEGKTAIHWAAEWGDPETVHILLAHGTKINC